MCWWHPFPGFTGVVLGPAIFGAIWLACFFTKEHEVYDLDPKGVPNTFEPHLVKYIRATEFVIGLATGSIVLLVGSSALHAQGGRVPWFYASPLILLAWSVVFGVAFMVWLIYSYEEYQHGNEHTKLIYTMSQTLGFTSVACFCIGYILLIFLVTR
jgi:hypothetical protein